MEVSQIQEITLAQFQAMSKYAQLGGFGSEPFMSARIGALEILSPEVLGRHQELAQGQALLFRALPEFYARVMDDPALAWVDRLIHLPLQSINSAAEGKLLELSRRSLLDHPEAFPRLFRMDEIGTSGVISEDQAPMGGLYHAHMLQEVFGDGAEKGKVLEALKAAYHERTGLENPTVTYHIGKGAWRYAWEFIGLAQEYNKVNGEGSAKASLIFDDEELENFLSDAAERRDFLEKISNSGVEVIFTSKKEDLQAHLEGTDIIHRLSDSIRFTNASSEPILDEALKGRLKIEPDLSLIYDNSQLVQALLFHPELTQVWIAVLGEKNFAQISSHFPQGVLVDTRHEKFSDLTGEIGKLRKQVINRQLWTDHNSEGQSQELLTSNEFEFVRAKAVMEAIRAGIPVAGGGSPLYLTKLVPTYASPQIAYALSPDGSLTWDETHVRRRTNPFVFNSARGARIFATTQYWTPAQKTETDYKVAGASGGGGIRFVISSRQSPAA